MKAVVVYESMYGNTHLVADAIAAGLGAAGEVLVVPVEHADAAALEGADLLVVGGPTHAHGMSHQSTRKAALEAAAEPGKELDVDPDAEGPGLRDWFDTIEQWPARAAAFDTRLDAPSAFTGRASKGIARKLRHHGCTVVGGPVSFLVSKETHLLPDEETHARDWGATLAAAL